MKYLKTFEKINKPKVGDYVICEIVDKYYKDSDFVNSNIGEIVEINIDRFQNNRLPVTVSYKDYQGKIIDSINFEFDEIKYWSKDKSELEHIIASKKYNL